jgi:hypothetical protein
VPPGANWKSRHVQSLLKPLMALVIGRGVP